MANAQKKTLAERYLGIRDDYSPSYKDMSDNLRSYLTVVAFSIAVKYLWELPHPDPISPYAFRGMAVLWGMWIVWFLWLTLIQTFYVAAGFMSDGVRVLTFRLVIRSDIKSEDYSATHRKVFESIAWCAALICMMFLFGTMYVIGALLALAQLK